MEHKKNELENKNVQLTEYKQEIERLDKEYAVCNENIKSLDADMEDIIKDESKINKLQSEQTRLIMV